MGAALEFSLRISSFLEFELWKFCSKLQDAVPESGEVKVIAASRAVPQRLLKQDFRAFNLL